MGSRSTHSTLIDDASTIGKSLLTAADQAAVQVIVGVDLSSYATTAAVAAGYQPLDSDLTAIAGLSTNGIAVRTGSGAWAIRTITIDSSNNISGVGTFSSGAITASGRITGTGDGIVVGSQVYSTMIGNGNSYDADGIKFTRADNTSSYKAIEAGQVGARTGFYGFNGSYFAQITSSQANFYTLPITAGAITASGRGTFELTTEQLRLAYNGSAYTGFTVNQYGVLEVRPTMGQTKVYGSDAYAFQIERTGFVTFGFGTANGDTYRIINVGTAGTLFDLHSTTKAATFYGLTRNGIYTVATLPSASANPYFSSEVSDALSPTVGATVAGGGSDKATVKSNGTNWKVTAVL